MLVLTRKVNQSVLIGHKIVVQVVETGGRVRLGISAPQSVRVVRAEFGATTERDHECPCCGFVEETFRALGHLRPGSFHVERPWSRRSRRGWMLARCRLGWRRSRPS